MVVPPKTQKDKNPKTPENLLDHKLYIDCPLWYFMKAMFKYGESGPNYDGEPNGEWLEISECPRCKKREVKSCYAYYYRGKCQVCGSPKNKEI